MATSAPASPGTASTGQPETQPAAIAEHAIFQLSRPITMIVEGTEVEINGLGMRRLEIADLDVLERFQGKAVSLAQNLVAALCDITVDHVRQMDLSDFAMLSTDALWQVELLSVEMGLPPRHFIQPTEQAA